MDNRLFEMQLYAALIERSSFTAASEAMLITPSAASKLIQRLEKRLGVRLVNRTTRSIAVTEEGLTYYNHAKRILQDIDDMESLISSSQQQVSGTLRFSAPSAFSAFHLPKLLAEFRRLYPMINFEVTFLDRFVDVVEERFDFAIRIGSLPTTKIHHAFVCENSRYLVASRQYAEEYGLPQSIEQLAQHQIINFTPLGKHGVWELMDQGRQISVPIQSSCCVNSGLAALILCQEGMGIAPAAEFAAASLIARGQLVRVLPAYVFPSSAIYILYPNEQYVSLRMKTMIEFLRDRMQVNQTVGK